jgi:hypothetical protein
MIYLSNAFSLNMVERDLKHLPRLIPQNLVQVKNLLLEGFESVVGHADTANIFGRILNQSVEYNRKTILLKGDDILVVGQYSGPRLPEGTKELPEGSSIEWWIISIGD